MENLPIFEFWKDILCISLYKLQIDEINKLDIIVFKDFYCFQRIPRNSQLFLIINEHCTIINFIFSLILFSQKHPNPTNNIKLVALGFDLEHRTTSWGHYNFLHFKSFWFQVINIYIYIYYIHGAYMPSHDKNK